MYGMYLYTFLSPTGVEPHQTYDYVDVRNIISQSKQNYECIESKCLVFYVAITNTITSNTMYSS